MENVPQAEALRRRGYPSRARAPVKEDIPMMSPKAPKAHMTGNVCLFRDLRFSVGGLFFFFFLIL